MLVFVCETVTGGYHLGDDLPASLIAEATLMRDSLIDDIEDIPGLSVITTHDARLPPPARGTSTALIPGNDVDTVWSLMAEKADCCWPIAPETGGLLEQITRQLRARCPHVIASDARTLNICASKLMTARTLSQAGISVVPTWKATQVPANVSGPFVIKPDDGAGSLDTRLFPFLPPPPFPEGLVVQPLIAGEPSSLTMLCQSGRTSVLSANLQHVRIRDGSFSLTGLSVGGRPVDEALRDMASRIGAALPGLHGIVGVDYVATRQGPVILEINPRLTTSYAGLRRALGINPAALVEELIRDGAMPDIAHLPPTIPVEVML